MLIFILFVFLLGNLICNYVLGLWGVGRKTLFFVLIFIEIFLVNSIGLE